MTTAILKLPAIADFARAVRIALGDLPAEDVEDLTDGLEADLEEHANEAADFTLGDPVEYAEELRTAAGLPRRASKTRGAMSGLIPWSRRVRADIAAWVGSHPLASRLLDFLVSLRPFWWMLRAWAVYEVACAVFVGSYLSAIPSTAPRWALLIVLSIVSVEWGRGKWAPGRWLRATRTLVSFAAIVALPFVAGQLVWQSVAESELMNQAYLPPQGLALNGDQVTNIFAYDANGNLLPTVQLFTQDGRPLDAVGDPAHMNALDATSSNGDAIFLLPSHLVPGRTGWNVYPFDVVGSSAFDTGVLDPTVTPTTPTAPFLRVQPLAGEPSALPTAVPTP